MVRHGIRLRTHKNRETRKVSREIDDRIRENELNLYSNKLKTGMKPSVNQIEIVNVMMTEREERDKRCKNVIIEGILEPTGVDASAKQVEDERAVKELLTKIGATAHPKSIRRLRKRTRNDKTELAGRLVVELASGDERNQVLMMSRVALKNSSDRKSVFVNADMTQAEAKMDYDLRKIRKELNDRNKNQNFRFGIRGNRVVAIDKDGKILEKSQSTSNSGSATNSK